MGRWDGDEAPNKCSRFRARAANLRHDATLTKVEVLSSVVLARF